MPLLARPPGPTARQAPGPTSAGSRRTAREEARGSAGTTAWRERVRQHNVELERETPGTTDGGDQAVDLTEALRARRSIKKFADREVTRQQLARLLEAAVLAPNHRLTQPWRFYVLGPKARRAYGEVLGGRKARKVDDPAAAALVREKVVAEHAALPAMIAVAMREDPNPEVREEDFAATMMAVQNLALAAVEAGLGTHLKTGAVMQDPGARAAVGVAEGERIVAVVNVGYPAEPPAPKPRTPAGELTTWTD